MEKKVVKFFLFIFLIIILLSVSINSSPVADKIEQDSTFKYTTSITGKYNLSDKADVYTIDMTVPETAMYIISQSKPESYTDLNNENSIQLFYDDYYVLIYKGENLKTYVQVSSRKYIHRNGYYGLYRPYNRNIIVFLDRTYTSGRYYKSDSERYGGGYYRHVSQSTNSSKINTSNQSSNKIRTDNSSSNKIKTKTNSGSIRSGSVGSRPSLGGGLGFGK